MSLPGLTPDDLVRAMVGRELVVRVPQEQNIGDTVLRVERLTREGVFVDVSFEVRAGEIVALAGLVGAGPERGRARDLRHRPRTTPAASRSTGKPLRLGSPTGAMAAGIGLVPEDRRQQGLVMEMSIGRNITLASLPPPAAHRD